VTVVKKFEHMDPFLEWEDRWPPSDPIEDGSQAVAHDGYDVTQAFYALRRKTMQRIIEERAESLPTFNPLARDAFWLFLKRYPDLDQPNVPLRPLYQVNRQMLQVLAGQDHYRALHDRVIGDNTLAAVATEKILDGLANSLSAEMQERLKRAAEREERRKRIQQAIDSISSAIEYADPKYGGSKNKQTRLTALLVARLSDLAALDAEIEEQDGGMLLSDAEVEAVGATLLVLLPAVAGEMEGLIDALGLYGGHDGTQGPGLGQGYDPGDPEGKRLAHAEKRTIADKVLTDERFKRLADIAGRHIEIAYRVQARRVPKPIDEVVGITQGSDFRWALPEEILQLNIPGLREVALARWADDAMLQMEVMGREPIGKGPIPVWIDDSGSMSGDPELWSKGIALAMARICQRQGRDLLIGHFDTRIVRQDIFPKGRTSPDLLMDSLSTFTGGGTIYEPWMRAAIQQAGESAWNNSDVVCITDGLCSVRADVLEEFNRLRAERGMRCFTILIGEPWGGYADSVKAFSDQFLQIKELDLNTDKDLFILETIFDV
jgi:uncharacterized protein with von Willebrand factor type A (vWA) domain